MVVLRFPHSVLLMDGNALMVMKNQQVLHSSTYFFNIFLVAPLDSCVDIDECSLGKCGANTDCINTDGDFECVCHENHIWKSGSDVPLTKGRLIK